MAKFTLATRDDVGSRGQSCIPVFQVNYELYRMLADALIGVVWMRLARCGGGAAGQTQSEPFSALVQWPVEGRQSGQSGTLGRRLVREFPEHMGYDALAHRTYLANAPAMAERLLRS